MDWDFSLIKKEHYRVVRLKGTEVYRIQRHLFNELNAKREGEDEWVSIVGVYDSLEFAEKVIEALIADRLGEEIEIVKSWGDEE